MSRLLITLFLITGALAAVAQPRTTARELTLDTRQQAALGIRTTSLHQTSGGLLLASATVTLPPSREILVTAPYAGVITRLFVGLGDPVRPTTALMALSSPQLAESRRQAREAQLEAQNTQAALQRDQAMYDEGLIPAARLQLTQNRQRAAEAAWQAQAASLRAAGQGPAPGADGYALGTVRSPQAGSVVEVPAHVGQRGEAGEVLFRIADTRQLQLDLVLAGDKASRLRAGATVLIPSREARATLTGISLALDAGGQAHARARVTSPGRLQLGEMLAVQVQQSAQGKQDAPAWEVPARSVLNYRGSTWVFQSSSKGFTLQPVQVLSGNDELAIVQGPLNSQARVASAGTAALRAMLDEGP